MQKSNAKLTVRKQSISKLSFNIIDIIVNGCIGDGGGGGGVTNNGGMSGNGGGN